MYDMYSMHTTFFKPIPFLYGGQIPFSFVLSAFLSYDLLMHSLALTLARSDASISPPCPIPKLAALPCAAAPLCAHSFLSQSSLPVGGRDCGAAPRYITTRNTRQPAAIPCPIPLLCAPAPPPAYVTSHPPSTTPCPFLFFLYQFTLTAHHRTSRCTEKLKKRRKNTVVFTRFQSCTITPHSIVMPIHIHIISSSPYTMPKLPKVSPIKLIVTCQL